MTIQRSKGLGENDPEMMWMTTMNPETRRLIKVMPEDVERTAYYFDILLGDNLAQRKNFIAETGQNTWNWRIFRKKPSTSWKVARRKPCRITRPALGAPSPEERATIRRSQVWQRRSKNPKRRKWTLPA